MGKCAAISCKQLGDTLLLQPALAKLAELHGTDVDLLTKPEFAPLLELMPGVRQPSGSRKYDELWVFEHGSKAAWRAFLCKASNKRLRLLRHNYRRWYHSLVFSDIAAKPLSYEYRALCHYRAVHGSEKGFLPPRLQAPDPATLPPDCPPGAVVLSPTSAWRSKAWTVDGWVQVVDRLTATHHLPILLIGQGDDWMTGHIDEISATCSGKIHNLYNRTSLAELLAIIASARAVIAIDGASAHLAAALAVPSLTLFGPTRADEWHWQTAQALALRTEDYYDHTRKSLRQLPVNSVLQKLDRLLILAEDVCSEKTTAQTGATDCKIR